MKTTQHIPLSINIIVFLLVLLWTYAALSKWADPTEFLLSLHRQPLPLPDLLFWALPSAELLAAALLIGNRTRNWGFHLSSMLLIAFSLYIAMGLAHIFTKVPCSCGGVLKHLGWKQHLAFNLIFLGLSTYASIYSLRKHIRT